MKTLLTIKTDGEYVIFSFENGDQIKRKGYTHWFKAKGGRKWIPYNAKFYFEDEEAKRKNRSTSEEADIWWHTSNIINTIEALNKIKKPRNA